MTVFTRRWERGCSGHAVIMSVRAFNATTTPVHVAGQLFLLWNRASPSRHSG
ncbi:hypothetical protein JOF29_008099 [Kribbella aluminosa]|uniref:Uncharacterized protein n=1 Tax=Kribbella aluminosa TaxID=416017 RepID=A0ABS4UZB9_9ACTN|nr:hypothetical protein [Kribbella aluminosa]